jgi:formylmethanofuran dehydrogenase subunit E
MCAPKNAWERCVEFHGHACPGLAIGYRASEAAANKMKLSFSIDEEVVCVTENDACGVDAVQVIMGCSFGKGNLIYRDTGKQAFSFFNRNTGDKVRIVFKEKPNWEGMDSETIQDYILKSPLEELFDFKEPAFAPPGEALIFKNIVCEQCGESAPEHKMRLQEGKRVCLDCFSDYARGW